MDSLGSGLGAMSMTNSMRTMRTLSLHLLDDDDSSLGFSPFCERVASGHERVTPYVVFVVRLSRPNFSIFINNVSINYYEYCLFVRVSLSPYNYMST